MTLNQKLCAKINNGVEKIQGVKNNHPTNVKRKEADEN